MTRRKITATVRMWTRDSDDGPRLEVECERGHYIGSVPVEQLGGRGRMLVMRCWVCAGGVS